MRIISVDELHPDFAEQIMAQPGGEAIRRCYACGTCAMSCPIREVNETFNPRRLIRMCLLGMKQEVLQSDFVWLCSNCYACQERCPQGIHIAELMCVLKNMAYRAVTFRRVCGLRKSGSPRWGAYTKSANSTTRNVKN